MAQSITFKISAKETKKFLNKTGIKAMQKAAAQSIRAATNRAHALSKTAITSQTTVERAEISKEVEKHVSAKPSKGLAEMRGTVGTNYRRLSLLKFQHSITETQGNDKGSGGLVIRIKKRGPQKKMPSAFKLLSSQKGGPGIFIRKRLIDKSVRSRRVGDKELPIQKLRAMSPRQLVEKKQRHISEGAQKKFDEVFPVRFNKQLSRLSQKAKSKAR